MTTDDTGGPLDIVCVTFYTRAHIRVFVSCVFNSLFAQLSWMTEFLPRGVHVHPYHSSDTRLPLCSCHDQSRPPKPGLVREGGDQSHASLPRLGYS